MEQIQLFVGDCIEVMKRIPEKSIHCVVTSPPYFGLRDYGTGKWEGGNPECDHKIPPTILGGGNNKAHIGSFSMNYKAICGKCGAIRVDKQIGLEVTPDEYVNKMIDVFRGVWRVLRDDGTVWLNLGDSWVGYKGENYGDKKGNLTAHTLESDGNRLDIATPQTSGLKNKDLIGIPWRVALALQADGWYLRQDIIWAKSNGMPESVNDRCTKSHEYIFLLTKSPRYYYDNEAIKEPVAASTKMRLSQKIDEQIGSTRVPGKTNGTMHAVGGVDGKRNCRDVWTIATAKFSKSHFATFPKEIPERCISAGTSAGGCCPVCGKPWQRTIEKIAVDTPSSYNGSKFDRGKTRAAHPKIGTGKRYEVVGVGKWHSACQHAGDPIPCIVMDPFNGAGTTGLVCIEHGLNYIGIDLNPEYIEMTRDRYKNVQIKIV